MKPDMKYTARSIALDTLIKIEKDEAYSSLALDETFRHQDGLDPRDRGLVTEIVYGTLQHQRYLDYLIVPLLKQELDKLDVWVKILLRMSIYQFRFLDRVPERAVVHEAVEIAKSRSHKGISGFVNGVLRRFLRDPLQDLTAIIDPIQRLGVSTSHPDWMVKRFVQQYGLDTTKEICLANNEKSPLTIRFNPLKTDRTQLLDMLSQQGYEIQLSEFSPQGLHVFNQGSGLLKSDAFNQGLFSIQDESSMRVSSLVDPQPGMHVLDVCAAPGGKSTHMAELMNNQGRIVSNDIHIHKHKLIQQAAKRLGIDIIDAVTGDATNIHDHVEGTFDRVLVDAPCSGLGVIRRKPDVKWTKNERDITTIAAVQLQILKAAAKKVKNGGFLVYSTCTIIHTENEDQTKSFLQDHPEFHLVADSEIQILPQQGSAADGFYMVKFVKQ